MAENVDPPSTHSFVVTLPLDEDGFFRRSCESCGLDFKLPSPPENSADRLHPYFRPAEAELGDDAPAALVSESNNENWITCPYCSHRALGKDMLPSHTRRYIRNCAMREVAVPLIQRHLSEMMKVFERPFGGSGALRVTVKHNDPVQEVRPIAGPEPNDLIRTDLLCCHKEMKILAAWAEYGKLFCPHCGSKVVIS